VHLFGALILLPAWRRSALRPDTPVPSMDCPAQTYLPSRISVLISGNVSRPAQGFLSPISQPSCKPSPVRPLRLQALRQRKQSVPSGELVQKRPEGSSALHCETRRFPSTSGLAPRPSAAQLHLLRNWSSTSKSAKAWLLKPPECLPHVHLARWRARSSRLRPCCRDRNQKDTRLNYGDPVGSVTAIVLHCNDQYFRPRERCIEKWQRF